MSTRQEVLEALQRADERIDRLLPHILAHPEAPLPEGEWRVRDCLSHLAARANVTTIVRTLEQRLAATRAGQAVQIDINAINHDQVLERKGLTVEELLAEVKAGHARARLELTMLSDEALARRFPNFRGPGDSSAAEMVLLNLQRHESGHLDMIEAAIAAAARKS